MVFMFNSTIPIIFVDFNFSHLRLYVAHLKVIRCSLCIDSSGLSVNRERWKALDRARDFAEATGYSSDVEDRLRSFN